MPISSILINFILFMGIGWLFRKSLLFRSVTQKVIYGSLIVSSVWLALSGFAYLLTPLFFDHSEASIASVGSYWWGGHAIYTDLTDPHRYSLLYGPWPYVVVGFFQSFGSNTILLAKIPGVLNLLLLFVAIYILAKDLQSTKFSRFLCMALMAAMLLGFYNFTYWIRPDSYLITYVFLAFVLVKKTSGKGAWSPYIGMAILAALATNSKAHGIIYFLPLVAYYLEVQPHCFSPLKFTLAAVVFVAVFFFPFVLPNISLDNYMHWLRMASHHGLQFSEFSKNITFVSGFLLLLWIFGLQREFKYTFYTLLAVSFLASVAGSKAGAGNNHLIPLLPVMLWFAVERYFVLGKEEQKRMALVVGAFAMTLILNGLNRQKRIQVLLEETLSRRAEFADLQALIERNEGSVEMGYSSTEAYLSTFYKPWMVAHRQVLLLDGASLMDLAASNIPIPTETVNIITNCEIQFFVMPSQGIPWTLGSYYEGKQIFSDEFKRAFASRYQVVEKTAHYHLYGCQK